MHTWRLPDREFRIDQDRCLILGIVNVTPDSFSDGGQFFNTDAAVAHGLQLVEQGADLLDIGGESTRPGSLPVTLDEELSRVVPVVERLRRQTHVPISIDTSKVEVARQCLDLGAQVINDVTGLRDPEMAKLAVRFQAGVVVMHMRGTPADMQVNPTYHDVLVDLYRFFEERLESLTQAGLDADRIALDPGIGFGKTYDHSLTLLTRLREFQALGRPLCLGVSRKGFLGQILDRPRDQRVIGGIAVLLHGMAAGAVQIARVHDVAETRDALKMWATLQEYRPKAS